MALDQIDCALGNGIRVSAWTFDELYGRDSKFLDGLETRGHLFCARIRQEYDNDREDQQDRITVEQVRSAINVWLDAADLSPPSRRKRFEEEIEKQKYYQRRNKQARKSHTKTRIRRLTAMGIDVEKIKSCISDTQHHDMHYVANQRLATNHSVKVALSN